jgi:16S rRNA (adenine1518-N6/adenine1519-N6)-dimethyltransferase
MKLSKLRAHLEAQGTHAKKRLSQNFLIDGNILKKIAAAAQVTQDDLVLEIGAGPGALTEQLLETGASVVAIEIDTQLIPILSELKQNYPLLKIIEGDVLHLSLESLCASMASQRKIKVVANLPYHITTPILTRLLPMHLWIESITVMVQKEFAQRMIAKANTSDYGRFTLFVRYYSDPLYQFTIKPSCFYPCPTVHSALVTCTLHPPPLIEDATFFDLTRAAFSQRRKMLRTSLRLLYPQEKIDGALTELKIDLKARPETLTLEQFLNLFHFLR